MADDPRAAVDALLDRLVDVLSGAGAAGGARTTTGTAADGGVVVTLNPPGRVDAVEIDPRMLRRREAVGPAVVAAFNEAQRARPDRGADTAATRAELAAIQEESVVVTQQLNGSLIATVERLKGL